MSDFYVQINDWVGRYLRVGCIAWSSADMTAANRLLTYCGGKPTHSKSSSSSSKTTTRITTTVTNMAGKVRISVDFLKKEYPQLSDLLEDEDLQSIVQLLANEMIETKAALQLVSREALLLKNFPALALDVLKPLEGRPLSCS